MFWHTTASRRLQPRLPRQWSMELMWKESPLRSLISTASGSCPSSMMQLNKSWFPLEYCININCHHRAFPCNTDLPWISYSNQNITAVELYTFHFTIFTPLWITFVSLSLLIITAIHCHYRLKIFADLIPIMIIPIRCFTCGKVIGNKWEAYLGLLQAEYQEGDALDALGLKR